MGIVYFHGAPGRPLELSLASITDCNVITVDRFTLKAATSNELVNALVERIDGETQREPVRLVGFSIGCRWALAVAARLDAQVERIDLISPLGPFGLGHYTDKLKGCPLVQMGRKWPRVLRFVLSFQALLVTRAPRKLLQVLPQDSRGEDAKLADDPAFRDLILALFRHSLETSRDGYWRELVFASEEWSPLLGDITMPVRIWHGSEDNWTAPGMSEELARHLPDGSVTILDGLSHYSALKRMLPVLLRQDSPGE